MSQLFTGNVEERYSYQEKHGLKRSGYDSPDGVAPELAPAIAAALIGLAGSALEPLSSTLKSSINSRGYHVKGIEAKFRYKNPPIKTQVIEVVQELKISLNTRGIIYNRNNNVYFRVTSITDGFSILSTSVDFLAGKSDIMTPDTFNLSFRAIELTSSKGADLRLKLQLSHGRYDPIGLGDYDFSGSLVISAKNGQAELVGLRNNPKEVSIKLRLLSPSNLNTLIYRRQKSMEQVYSSMSQGAIKSQSPVGNPKLSPQAITKLRPLKIRKHRRAITRSRLPNIRRLPSLLGIEIFFSSGSSRLSQRTQEEIMYWFSMLSGQHLHGIRNGSYPIKLIGYASSDGSLRSNLRLSQKRATSVANFLKSQLGLSLNIQVRARGEIFPLNSSVASSLQRKVEIRIG